MRYLPICRKQVAPYTSFPMSLGAMNATCVQGRFGSSTTSQGRSRRGAMGSMRRGCIICLVFVIGKVRDIIYIYNIYIYYIYIHIYILCQLPKSIYCPCLKYVSYMSQAMW